VAVGAGIRRFSCSGLKLTRALSFTFPTAPVVVVDVVVAVAVVVDSIRAVDSSAVDPEEPAAAADAYLVSTWNLAKMLRPLRCSLSLYLSSAEPVGIGFGALISALLGLPPPL